MTRKSEDDPKAARDELPREEAPPPFHWTPAMSVGVPELVEDHKGLIRVINLIKENAEGGEGAEAALRQCLRALTRYAEVHFGREEQVMIASLFPGQAHHREEHRAFVERMKEVVAHFESDPKETTAFVAQELFHYLTAWLQHHIMLEDMAYRPYAEQRLVEAREAARQFRPTQLWYSD
jgi:hemerythrin